jgi:hypothetical protein
MNQLGRVLELETGGRFDKIYGSKVLNFISMGTLLNIKYL